MYSNLQNETGRPEGRPADAQPGRQSVEDVQHGTHTDVCMLGTSLWRQAAQLHQQIPYIMTAARKRQAIGELLSTLRAALRICHGKN